MRAVVLALALPLAFAFVVLAGIFDLNGEQWAWWRSAAWAGAALIVVAAILWPRLRSVGGSGAICSSLLAAVLVGAVLIGVSVWVMARRYSDPYGGSFFWPRALAVIAFVGLALIVVSVAVCCGARHRGV